MQQGGASSSVRSRAPQGSAEEALGALCEGLAAMAAPELRSAALYGAALLAERLGEPRRVQELLRPALAELVLGAEAARHQREGRKQIHGDAARAEEIREVRRSWNAEVEAGNAWKPGSWSRFRAVFRAFRDRNGREVDGFGRQMQWFDLLRGAGGFRASHSTRCRGGVGGRGLGGLGPGLNSCG